MSFITKQHVVLGLALLLALLVALSCSETDRAIDEIIDPGAPPIDVADLVASVEAEGCPGVRRQGAPPTRSGGGKLATSGQCNAGPGVLCENAIGSSTDIATVFVTAEVADGPVRAYYEIDPDCGAAAAGDDDEDEPRLGVRVTIEFADPLPENLTALGLAYMTADDQGRTTPVETRYFDVRFCGDGVLDTEAGELCDDGNREDGDCCSSACLFDASGSTCEDGLFCTVDDVCDGAGTCEGALRDCDDSNICTDDSCNEETDVCDNAFDGSNDPSCLCGNGELDAGEECDDGNNDDGDCCASTCELEASGSACDDGLFCTVDDTCDGAGSCDGGARDCDDGELCTDDVCDEDADACDSAYDESNDPSCVLCGNGVLDDGEECDDGNLDDGDCCASTCAFESSGSICDDDLFCTVFDVCDGAGACGGAARSCDDGEVCTDDVCDENGDACDNTYDESNDPSCPACFVSLAVGEIQVTDINPAAGQYAAADVEVPVSLTSNVAVREIALNLVPLPGSGLSRDFSIPCESLPAASGFQCQFSAGGPGIGRYRFFSSIGATLGPAMQPVDYLQLNFNVSAATPEDPLVFSLTPDLVDVIDTKGEACAVLDAASGSVTLPDNSGGP
ncbi:MAG: hypothetical protein GY716_23280 [bacterium]|nr:hypothetical protein [bacterium]